MPNKRGRPRLRRAKRRSLYLTLRVSPEEREAMRSKAGGASLTVWARERLLA